MKKKLLLLLAICLTLVAIAMTLSACDLLENLGGQSADSSSTTTVGDGGTTTTTTTTTTTGQTPTVTRIYLIDGSPVGTQTVAVDDITTPHIAVPEKTHYDGKWELFSALESKLYYNAVYTPTEYTVTFVANGVTVNTQSYTILDKNITAPQVPDAQHFESSAWDSYTLDGGNKIVNAIYGTPIEYTVTFVANGEAVDTRIYTVENKSITAPNIPSKQHYSGEWEKYILNGGNKTVNAIYTPTTYTVNFVANGEPVGTQTYTVENNSITEPALPDITYGYYSYWENYTLDGGNKTVNAIFTDETQAKYALEFNGLTYYVSGYNYIVDGNIEILSKYKGKPVTSIKAGAFEDCTSLTSVTFGENSQLTSIGGRAFDSCKNLKSIEIPSSVTSIGKMAFWDCDGLTSITIPSSVTSIGDEAFSGCNTLTIITIPPSVTSIGDGAFEYCTSLSSVTFGENSQLTSIGCSVFEDCTSLTSITIPSSIIWIFDRAFYGCTSLTSTTIPSSVTSIGDEAFKNCYKLVEVYDFSKLNITKGSYNNGCVGYYALDIYTDINTPSKLFEDENGFIIYTDGNKKILVGYKGDKTDIIIPDGVTEIYKYTFDYCYSLKSITIPSSVTSIGEYAFECCTSLESVTFGENSQLTSIGNSAFYYCPNLKSITIPSSVTSIGEYAFDDCYKLVEVYNLSTLNITKGGEDNGLIGYLALDIYIDINTPSKLSEDKNGFIIYTDGDKKILVGYNGKKADVVIPHDITEIYKYAFYNCDNLTSVTFGKNSQLTSIGDYAFRNCTSLTSITIPSSVTSIGNSAFYYCTSLSSVIFKNPNGWWYASSSTATSGTAITGLSDTSTAATYLKSTYYNYYWKRS